MTLLSDADKLGRELDIAEMLGPATLAYLDPAGFRPRPGPDVITLPGAGDPVLERFFSETEPAELDESGISDITSPVFAIFEQGQIVAAAGYRDWPGQIAHLSVLTARPRAKPGPGQCGRSGSGLARPLARQAASMVGTAATIPARRPLPRLHRARLAGQHPPDNRRQGYRQ